MVLMVIKIDGTDITVKSKPIFDTEGEFCPSELTIYLNQNASYQLKRRVLAHELTHAIMHICARGLSDYAVAMQDSDKAEEMIAEQIGERLFRVLEDNEKLRKFLFGGDR